MDQSPENFDSLGDGDVLREAVSIPRAAPRTFALVTLALVFPLSFAILTHSLFTHPIVRHIAASHGSVTAGQLIRLFAFQFGYLLFLFAFSLLSTAAVVFTVASLYTGKPASFSSSMAAIPPILPRLFRTFTWVFVIMLVYHSALLTFVVGILVVAGNNPSPWLYSAFAVTLVAFIALHLYITALWHLASVVSVLEQHCGVAAIAKSWQLLRGRRCMAGALVASYIAACGIIGVLFRAAVVKGPNEEGSLRITSILARTLIGSALVSLLVIVNLVGLLAQSVFYFVCKSFHGQEIDKSVLFDHLDEYLGEYLPLKNSIQMEDL